MDRETAKAINALSKKMNSIDAKLDAFIQQMHNDNRSDIDYIAMMTDVELEQDTEEEVEADA